MLRIFNFHRIRYKLVFVFSVLIIGILAVVIPVTYINTVKVIRNQSVILNDKLVELGKNNLDSVLGEIDKLFRSLYINKSFKEYFFSTGSKNQYDSFEEYTGIRNTLLSFINIRKDIFSIYYIDRDNRLFYATRYEAGHEDDFSADKMPEWFDRELDETYGNMDKIHFFPTRVHLPLNLKVTNPDEKVFSISRCIINVEKNYEPVGALFINMDLSTIKEIVADIKPYKESLTYILSPDGVIVYDSSQKRTGDMLENEVYNMFGEQKGNMQLDMKDGKYIAVYTTSLLSGWKVINFIPTNVYTANVSFITKTIIIICVFAVIISIMVTLLIASHISRPVEKLTGVMKTIETGNMNLRTDESGNDEIAVLGKSFNSLISRLQDVIHKQYEAGIRQKDAELKALQAQINPHFLYNVLQSISSISILHNIGEINVMAKSLANMLRYNVKTEKSVVTVRDEYEHVMNYLSIQNIRYGEKLEYDINVPRYLYNYSLLKLTLQPVVENSIIHGFNEKEEKGIIHLAAKKEGEYILFDISDNGKGIPHSELDRINRELHTAETAFYSSEHPSIGLKNVLVRLKIYYNYLADMHIESEEGIGTSVIIKVPAYLNEGDDVI